MARNRPSGGRGQWVEACPACGAPTLYVFRATLVATGKTIYPMAKLCAQGFGFELPIGQKDGSTEDERVFCAACEQQFTLDQLTTDSESEYIFTVRSVTNEKDKLDGSIIVAPGAVMVKLIGYGTCVMEDGRGFPVCIELSTKGSPKVMVWADINNEDPTHMIDLCGASESARKIGS